MIESYHFGNHPLLMNSDQDNQWMLKKKEEEEAYWRIGYSHSPEVFPHWLSINYKGELQ